MTAHEMRPEMLDTTPEVNQAPAPTSEPAFSETNSAPAPLDEPVRQEPLRQDHEPLRQEPMQQESVHPATAPEPVATPADTSDQTLFADRELSDFHSRWTEVQSAFVDDPRDCVQKADALVADVV